MALLNTLSWSRGGLVTLPAEQSQAGNHVLDDQGKEVPAQRLATGELAFLASEVPAFGSRLYRVAAGKQQGEASSECKAGGGTLENGLVRVTLRSQDR